MSIFQDFNKEHPTSIFAADINGKRLKGAATLLSNLFPDRGVVTALWRDTDSVCVDIPQLLIKKIAEVRDREILVVANAESIYPDKEKVVKDSEGKPGSPYGLSVHEILDRSPVDTESFFWKLLALNNCRGCLYGILNTCYPQPTQQMQILNTLRRNKHAYYPLSYNHNGHMPQAHEPELDQLIKDQYQFAYQTMYAARLLTHLQNLPTEHPFYVDIQMTVAELRGLFEIQK